MIDPNDQDRNQEPSPSTLDEFEELIDGQIGGDEDSDDNSDDDNEQEE